MDEATKKLIQAHVDQIREHVDTVRIFVTKATEDDASNTDCYDVGSGNFFAQIGHIKDWIIVMDQRTRNFITEQSGEE